jgi:uncharacterized protein DUF4437
MWTVLAVSFLLLLVSPARVYSEDANLVAGSSPEAHWELFKPDQVPWREGPSSLLPGAQVAILEGDPTKDGLFTMRLKLPDGYRVLPHWHPKTERLTIIQGIVNLGTGDRFDVGATQALSAGTYSSMPPKMTHFAWIKRGDHSLAEQYGPLGGRVCEPG